MFENTGVRRAVLLLTGAGRARYASSTPADSTRSALSPRAAIAAHRSQVSDSSFFLQMPPEMFDQAFGREWFIEHGRAPGLRMGWLFD